jgi:hypothetical protein
MKALQKLLQARNVMFQHNHGKPMSCKGTAQLLSNTLYYKRFFPYYTFNLCAGLDDEGEWVAVVVVVVMMVACFVGGGVTSCTHSICVHFKSLRASPAPGSCASVCMQVC